MPERIRSKAIVQHGEKLVEEEVTLPELKEHEILVKVHHAALNPTDGTSKPSVCIRPAVNSLDSVGLRLGSFW